MLRYWRTYLIEKNKQHEPYQVQLQQWMGLSHRTSNSSYVDGQLSSSSTHHIKPHSIHIQYPWLYYFMYVASFLAAEHAFIIMLPIFCWLFSFYIMNRFLIIWVFTFYLGQSLKEIFRIARPQSRRILRLEHSYSSEYGFPSTHSQCAFSLNLYILYFFYTRFEISNYVALAILAMSFFTAISRLYFGVHSFMDVLGGMVLGLVVFCNYLLIDDWVELFMREHPYHFAACTLLIGLLLIICYPLFMGKNESWRCSYGDMVRIIASGTSGLLATTWLAVMAPTPSHYHYPFPVLLSEIVARQPLLFPEASELPWLGFKFCMGVLSIYAVKVVMKKLLYAVVPTMIQQLGLGKAHVANIPNHQRYIIEIPCVTIQYFCMGFVGAGAAYFFY